MGHVFASSEGYFSRDLILKKLYQFLSLFMICHCPIPIIFIKIISFVLVQYLQLGNNMFLNSSLGIILIHFTAFQQWCNGRIIYHRLINYIAAMNYQFWKRYDKRHDNPSLKSKDVCGVLDGGPASPQKFNPKNDFKTAIKINERMPQKQMAHSHSQIIKIPPLNPELRQRLKLVPQPSLSYFPKPNIPSDSKFTSLRSSSLSKLNVINSDRQVYNKQRREVNIITQQPREYVDSIKVFPKIRFQRYDQDYWRRRSFIEGQPERAFEYYRTDPMDLKRSLHEGMKMGAAQK